MGQIGIEGAGQFGGGSLDGGGGFLERGEMRGGVAGVKNAVGDDGAAAAQGGGEILMDGWHARM